MTGYQNNIIAEFNATGALQSVDIFGSNDGEDFLNSMVCDANNNLFFSGYSYAASSYNPVTKTGWYNNTSTPTGSNTKCFVGEFNSSNTEQWLTLFGSGFGDQYGFLSLNGGDNLYMIEGLTLDYTGTAYIFPYVQSPYANAYFFQNAAQFGSISRFDVNSTFTGIAEVNNPTDNINVYPNPTNDILYISIPGNDNTMKQIKIVNMLGQVMETISSADNHLKIDCSGMSSGVYIISVNTNENTYSSKFVIN